ncbi:MAG: hypothetical protein ACK559_40320, partial [bacterium]
ICRFAQRTVASHAKGVAHAVVFPRPQGRNCSPACQHGRRTRDGSGLPEQTHRVDPARGVGRHHRHSCATDGGAMAGIPRPAYRRGERAGCRRCDWRESGR